jgi:hypothetical protein
MIELVDKDTKTAIRNILHLGQAWRFMPAIPAQEMEVGRSRSEAGPGKKNMRSYLKNKLKQKGLGTWLKQ